MSGESPNTSILDLMTALIVLMLCCQAMAVKPSEKVLIWMEDATPPGSKSEGNTPWKWINKKQGPVYSGEKSVVRTAKGASQHFFHGASKPLIVGSGDILFAYVFLDPKNPPKQIMMQWNDGNWEHRAVWGADLMKWGAAGTPARRMMGKLPPTGRWVRLQINAQAVGIKPGGKINGWAFTQFDGSVAWDQAGLIKSSKTLLVERKAEAQAKRAALLKKKTLTSQGRAPEAKTKQLSAAEVRKRREDVATKAYEAAKIQLAKGTVEGYFALKDVERRYRDTEAASQASEQALGLFEDIKTGKVIRAAVKERDAADLLRFAKTYIKIKRYDSAYENLRKLVKDYRSTKVTDEAAKLLEEVRKLRAAAKAKADVQG
jgi:hypothetical protein